MAKRASPQVKPTADDIARREALGQQFLAGIGRHGCELPALVIECG